MSRLNSLLLVCLLAACSTDSPGTVEAAGEHTTTSTNLTPDEAAIHEAFAELQTACKHLDGPGTRARLGSETKAYWVRLRELALHANKEELQSEGPTVRLSVFVLRVKAGYEPIGELDEDGMIDYALRQGLFGRTMIVGKQLGELEIDGDRAECAVTEAGEPKNIRFAFVREDGIWRFDQTPIFEATNEIWSTKIGREPDLDVDAYLFFLVGNATGNGGTDELWKPLAE